MKAPLKLIITTAFAISFNTIAAVQERSDAHLSQLVSSALETTYNDIKMDVKSDIFNVPTNVEQITPNEMPVAELANSQSHVNVREAG